MCGQQFGHLAQGLATMTELGFDITGSIIHDNIHVGLGIAFFCLVALGSMPYSAVIRPLPLPRKNGGIFSSTVALHNTRVSPNEARTEPSA